MTQQKQEPVAHQVYRCQIKTRKQIDKEIPREKQGWWADISAGQKILLRQAVQADIDRCTLNNAHSKDPADYMCETFTNGSLVSKAALEYMNPEQNVYAYTSPPQRQPIEPVAYPENFIDALRYNTALREFEPEKAQKQEPVAWMHWLHGPVRVFLNVDEATMELDHLNREYPVDADARKMRPLVFGDTSPPQPKEPVQEPCDMGVACIGCSQRNSNDSCPHEKPNGACDCYVIGFNDGMKELEPPQRKPLTDEQTIILKNTTCPEIDWKARYFVEMNNGERNKWMLEWFIAFKVAIEEAHGITGEKE